ncbi:hypothetical protein N7465_006035 [Penicillium sp. CMV-2018d]|nr:hypothetical protein N7465_006035 [Penicillium sp. CMV-2018d]
MELIQLSKTWQQLPLRLFWVGCKFNTKIVLSKPEQDSRHVLKITTSLCHTLRTVRFSKGIPPQYWPCIPEQSRKRSSKSLMVKDILASTARGRKREGLSYTRELKSFALTSTDVMGVSELVQGFTGGSARGCIE